MKTSTKRIGSCKHFLRRHLGSAPPGAPSAASSGPVTAAPALRPVRRPGSAVAPGGPRWGGRARPRAGGGVLQVGGGYGGPPPGADGESSLSAPSCCQGSSLRSDALAALALDSGRSEALHKVSAPGGMSDPRSHQGECAGQRAAVAVGGSAGGPLPGPDGSGGGAPRADGRGGAAGTGAALAGAARRGGLKQRARGGDQGAAQKTLRVDFRPSADATALSDQTHGQFVFDFERIGSLKHFSRERPPPEHFPAPPARRGRPPAWPAARRSAAPRACGWCWTGGAGWGKVAPQGGPGGTASGRTVGKRSRSSSVLL